MKVHLSSLALLALAAFGSAGAAVWAAPITYTLADLGVSGAQATGTITTDGAIGILTASDITSWNIALIDGVGHTGVTLTPIDSTFAYGNNFPTPRNPLTATATALNFNFSDSFPSDFVSFNGPLGQSVCYGNGACLFAASADYMVVAVEQGTFTSAALTGTQAIATAAAPTSSTPEPSSAILVSGVLMALAVRRVRR
jgi:hypothetical protein